MPAQGAVQGLPGVGEVPAQGEEGPPLRMRKMYDQIKKPGDNKSPRPHLSFSEDVSIIPKKGRTATRRPAPILRLPEIISPERSPPVKLSSVCLDRADREADDVIRFRSAAERDPEFRVKRAASARVDEIPFDGIEVAADTEYPIRTT